MATSEGRPGEPTPAERLCRCVAAGQRCRTPLTGASDYCAFCTAWGCEKRERGEERRRLAEPTSHVIAGREGSPAGWTVACSCGWTTTRPTSKGANLALTKHIRGAS